MKILHTSFECYPFAKVGGLADVVGALPKYLNATDCQAEVVLPFFNKQKINSLESQTVYKGTVTLSDKNIDFEIRKVSQTENIGFPVYLLFNEELLFTDQIYGLENDTQRFLFFQIAVLNWLTDSKIRFDIIHCHDHHTGLIPFLIAHAKKYNSLSKTPTILTIHNAQYQGQFSYDKLNYLPDFDPDKIGLLDWYGELNPLATGIKCAWRVTTVSPGYMKELQQEANGLEGLLRSESQKCLGILNGIDTDVWDPETDVMLNANYNRKTLLSGRKNNKEYICKKYNLNPEKPLFSFIGRLVYEKGADLLSEAFSNILQSQDCSILALGSGNPDTEAELVALKDRFPENYSTYIGYDEALSHKIYGATDFLLMPSRVEPCGLNQLYALRYGAIPIVRRTGGLRDTVIDIGDANGFGICHNQASVFDICYSMERAITLYKNQSKFESLQKQIVRIDHSWNHSAKHYKNLYQSLKPNV